MLTEQLLQRINVKTSKIDLKMLPLIMREFAYHIPFENLDIMARIENPLVVKQLAEKIFLNHRGGVCYELNPLFYAALKEQGLQATLESATVFEPGSGEKSKTGDSHVLTILKDAGKEYIVDVGFGNNLPLMPVPLNGDIIHSKNGSFFVKDDILYMKRLHRDTEFKKAYELSRKEVSEKDLQSIQSIIMHDAASAFNKQKLVAQCTPNGFKMLNEGIFIQTDDGVQNTKNVRKDDFYKYIKEFNITL